MGAFDFSGRTVFVAGGTSGINLGIAKAFAKAGARVAVMSRSAERVEAAAKVLQQYGGKVLGHAADVRDAAAIERALAATHAAFGAIDVVVSGAAGNFPAAALGMSANGFKAVIDIDLIGTFNVLRAAHRFLRKPGASIVNISAPQAVHATAMQAHVCAAKAGVDMLTRVLCLEWGGDGIRVNSVIPGPIEGTEGMARLAPTEKEKEAWRGAVPLGRFGSEDDVANLVLFLSSPLASYISGAVIPVDGGRTANGAASLGAALEAAIASSPARPQGAA
jgi:NAD(P)-dependent dehydrogenase (short-subunit alcohol dehydrogenase family)